MELLKETSVGLSNTLQKVLLTCGILASLLKVGTHVLQYGLDWQSLRDQL
jgi:hypothetical protein